MALLACQFALLMLQAIGEFGNAVEQVGDEAVVCDLKAGGLLPSLLLVKMILLSFRPARCWIATDRPTAI